MCARTILSALARRAYRRPVDRRRRAHPHEFLRRRTRQRRLRRRHRVGASSEFSSARTSCSASSSTPKGRRPDTTYRVTDLELASRLSFFLWSSIPDDELLDLAARGGLRDPAVLERQVRRMLARRSGDVAHRRTSRRSGCSFAICAASCRIPTLFPEFDENLREAFRQETELFVRSQMRDDRSVGELLSADYTFVNERLARHYGIPDVYGSRFRRVPLTDGERGGLLGQGSLLTITSYPESHVARAARKVAAREHPGRAAAAAAARCAGAARQERRAASGSPCVRGSRSTAATRRAPPVTRRWTRSGLRSSTSTRSANGGRSTKRRPPIDASGALPGGETFQGLEGLAVAAPRPPRTVRRDGGRTAARLLARPRRRVLRSSDATPDRSRCERRRLSLVVDHPGDRQERAVSDAKSRIMIITTKAVPRRTILRGLGASLALPLLDSMVPALTAASQTPATPSSASASSTCPTAWSCRRGLRRRKAPDSNSCRR